LKGLIGEYWFGNLFERFNWRILVWEPF